MVLGLKDSCEYEGYEVSVARDGKEGLEKASTEKPDIILVEVKSSHAINCSTKFGGMRAARLRARLTTISRGCVRKSNLIHPSRSTLLPFTDSAIASSNKPRRINTAFHPQITQYAD